MDFNKSYRESTGTDTKNLADGAIFATQQSMEKSFELMTYK